MARVEVIKGGWLTLNRSCDLRCHGCYAVSSAYRTKVMPFELASKLISLLSEVGAKSVILIGGEPTLYRHLVSVVRNINQTGMKPILVSNGLRFANRSFARKIASSGLSSITLSLKSDSEEGYRLETGRFGFGRFLEGLYNLKSFGLKPSVSITITTSLLVRLRKAIEVILDTGVDHLAFNLASPVINGRNIYVDNIPNPQQLAEAIKDAHFFLKGKDISYGFNVSIPLCLLPPNIKQELMEEQKILTTCHVPKGTGIVFSEDGSIIPCNHFVGHKLGQYGIDFSTRTELLEFWNSQAVEDFRQACRHYPNLKCTTCEDWDKCGGGCLIKWLHWNPLEFIPGM